MKMKSIRTGLLAAGFVLALGISQTALAAVITSSLGNTTSGFVDGAIVAVPDVGQAQNGPPASPAPFDTSYGTDGLFDGNFMQDWTFNYAAIADTILSASLTIGIYDHDSSASGSQLAAYDIDGHDLTTTLDGLFEAGGGADSQYNIYTIDLAASLFSDLADGSAIISLDLTGPGLSPPSLFPPGPSTETSTNGANLIFSTLTITTQDAQTVPEPGSLVLVGLGFLVMSLVRRRRSFLGS